MFIVYPSNVDYLIDDIRLHVGDLDGSRFSDSLVRSSIVAGVKMLQRRWQDRYIAYSETMITPAPEDTVVPSGLVYVKYGSDYFFVASGLNEGDVVRSPNHSYNNAYTVPISQEDEYIIILAASIMLHRVYFSSSINTFMSWSEGEYSFSNITAGKSYKDVYDSAVQELNDIFGKRRLAKAVVGEFKNNTLIGQFTGL